MRRKKQSETKTSVIRAKQFEEAVSNLLKLYKIDFIRIDYRCTNCGFVFNKQNKGLPDFFCYLDGFAIECKTAGGKLTKGQKDIREKMENKGIKYIELHDTIDELLDYLDNR